MTSLNTSIHQTFSAVLFGAIVACSGGERNVVEPPPPPSGTATLTVLPDAEDLSSAQQLGWASGIPIAEVTIRPADSSSAPKSFATNSSGAANLGVLSAGSYLVEARRVLSAQEIVRVGAGTGVDGFVGAALVDISPVNLAVSMRASASKRRSLVISEEAWSVGYDGGLPYDDGGYFELYNNADSTIYLDGMTVGFAFNLYVSGALTCQQTDPLRNDPGGVWALYHQMFPGTGRQYPIQPGGIIVVAQDAIDHNPFYAGMPDLRKAHFEFVGPADVDNPGVPNMIDRSYDSLNPHGMPLMASGFPAFVALPVSLETLPRQLDPRGSGRREWRFPASSIVDVISNGFLGSSANRLCPEMINKVFDRQAGFFISNDDKTGFMFSPQRKKLGTTPDGRVILQHTRTTSVDFAKGPITPGKLQ